MLLFYGCKTITYNKIFSHGLLERFITIPLHPVSLFPRALDKNKKIKKITRKMGNEERKVEIGETRKKMKKTQFNKAKWDI